jgi:hypothetical protein
MPNVEDNTRGSWHGGASRAAQQRRTVALFFRSLRHAVPCNVRIIRIAPSRLDDDNLARAAKAVRDQLAEWLGVDDRDERVSWCVAQTKGGVREYAVRVIVRPWSPSEAGGRIIRGAEVDDVAVVLTPEARESLTQGLMFAGARPVVVEVAGVRLTFTTATPRPVEASGTPAAGVVATSGRPEATTGAVGAPTRRRNTRRRET